MLHRIFYIELVATLGGKFWKIVSKWSTQRMSFSVSNAAIEFNLATQAYSRFVIKHANGHLFMYWQDHNMFRQCKEGTLSSHFNSTLYELLLQRLAIWHTKNVRKHTKGDSSLNASSLKGPYLILILYFLLLASLLITQLWFIFT